MTQPKLFRSIFDKLARQQIITPYLDLGITGGNWPLKYTITIDSSPYYGLDDDGTPDGYFHPSTHGKLYDKRRLLWYMMHPAYRDKLEVEPPSLQREMTFAMGSALHGVVQTQFTMLGLCKCDCTPGDTHTCEDIEREYTNEAHHSRGRNDFIVSHPVEGRVPIEMKSMNSMSFAKLDDTIESMKLEWKVQLSMALDNLGYPWGVLLVFQAGWPYRFVEIRYPRDDALLSEVYAAFDDVNEHLALDTPPQFCCAYNSKTMKSCPARFVCYLANQKVGS